MGYGEDTFTVWASELSDLTAYDSDAYESWVEATTGDKLNDLDLIFDINSWLRSYNVGFYVTELDRVMGEDVLLHLKKL